MRVLKKPRYGCTPNTMTKTKKTKNKNQVLVIKKKHKPEYLANNFDV